MATNNFYTDNYIEKLMKKLRGDDCVDSVHTLETPLEYDSLASSDAAWFKVKGLPDIKNGDVPDDSPASSDVYIGPFFIYETDY